MTDRSHINRRNDFTQGPSPSKKTVTKDENNTSIRMARSDMIKKSASQQRIPPKISKKTMASSSTADASRKRIEMTVQNQQDGSGISSAHKPMEASSQLRLLDDKVKVCARKYNEAKAQADALEREVNSQMDGLAQLELEAAALDEMVEGKNVDAKKISTVSQEIEEAHNCSEEKLLYRRQLNYMHQRLGDDSIALDGLIGEMTTTLSYTRKEKDRSRIMIVGLESNVSCARTELDGLVKDLHVAENQRHRELSKKKQEAADAERMEQWNINRINSNMAMHESLADEYRSERDGLKRTLRERRSQLRALNKSMDEIMPKLASLEDTLTQVEQATGVMSIVEMVTKMKNYDEYRLRLTRDKVDAEERLKVAKSSLEIDEDVLSQLKTQGLSTTELNRDLLDGIKSSIAAEKTGGKIIKSTNKRLENLLVGLRQGGIGLYNRLLPFHSSLLNEEAPVLGEMDSTNAVQAASDTMEMINFTEKVLGKMLLEIGGIRFVTGKEIASPESPTEIMNCRVLPKTQTEGGEATCDDSTVDSCEDIPSRSNLKTASQMHAEAQIMSDALKSKRKKKRLKKKGQPPLTQKDSEHDQNDEAMILNQSDSQAATTIAPNLKNLTLSTPTTRSRKGSGESSYPRDSEPPTQQLDHVQAFLTEIPLSE